ncbi:MAG: agmatinase [Pseudomonadota bacterium]
MDPDFLASELLDRRPEVSRFHIVPVPMETSVSYGSGTSRGPGAILTASQQLEAWDGHSTPLSMGIHTQEAVDCSGGVQVVLDRIGASVNRALSFSAVPVLLGGEHTITLGALRALKSGNSKPFAVLQLDAHADLRNVYQGSRYSHACVMRRAVDDLGLSLFQIGVRALSKEEADLRGQRSIGFLDARNLHLNGIPVTLVPQGFPDDIYITLDVDGLDPSVIRATGTPVPGGVGWHDALTILERFISGRTVLGFDVVELAPAPGDHGSDFAAAQLVYSVMGIIQRLGR